MRENIPKKGATPAQEFWKTLKWDIAQFPMLKHEWDWDIFDRNWLIYDGAQGLSNVLNPNYVPTSSDDIKLWEEIQTYAFSTLNKPFQTNKGRARQRKNARAVEGRATAQERAALLLRY
jgi:hypothetical protein